MRIRSGGSRERKIMILLLVIVGGLTIYLVDALIHPERY
ncbi:potassium-transporting ATPase subunit F [Neobacillus drentensis]